jgi:hypothetical protein
MGAVLSLAGKLAANGATTKALDESKQRLVIPARSGVAANDGAPIRLVRGPMPGGSGGGAGPTGPKSITGLLSRQVQILEEIRDILKGNVELQKKSDQAKELNDLKNKKVGGVSGVIGKVGGVIARVGLGAIAGAWLIGFMGSLMKWGKGFQGMYEKWFGPQGFVTKIQKQLKAWGDKVQELTGSKFLGGIVRSLLPISAALSALAIFMPGTTMKMLRGLGSFIKIFDIGDAAKMGKLLKVSKNFMKAIPLIGEIVLAVEGLYYGITGFMKGYKDGGLMGGLKAGIENIIHGIVGGILELLQDAEVWILDKLGFSNLAAALDEMDVHSLLDNIMSGVEGVISTVGDFFVGIFNAIKNFDYVGLMQGIIDSLPIPDKLKAGIKAAAKLTVGAAGAAAAGASTVYNYGKGKLDQAASSVRDVRDNLDRRGAAAVRGQTQALGAQKKPIAGASSLPTAAPQARVGRTAAAPTMTPAMTSSVAAGAGAGNLEAEAKGKGLSDEDIAYTYETDRMMGAPKGATLAQLKQESGFNPNARSPTGAVGISQFTNIAVEDVLYNGPSPHGKNDPAIKAMKQKLLGNIRLGLEFHRKLMMRKLAGGKGWMAAMRDYNGDKTMMRNGMQARDDYVNRISGYLGGSGAGTALASSSRPAPSPRSAAAVSSSSTELARETRSYTPHHRGAAPTHIDQSKTTITHNQSNHAPNLTASTPVEFAPHVT